MSKIGRLSDRVHQQIRQIRHRSAEIAVGAIKISAFAGAAIRPLLHFRRLRLASGVTMFAFLATHLLNHALGIISLPTAESALGATTAIWRTPAGTALLYGAAALHVAQAYWTLYSRQHWHIPLAEIIRLSAGFSFPLLLIGHVTTTRLGSTFFQIDPTYTTVITNLQASGSQGMQMALLAPGWLHGCLGLWISLRRFALMRRLRPMLLAIMFVVPALAALGYLRMAHGLADTVSPSPSIGDNPIAQITLAKWRSRMTWWYTLSIAATVVLGRLREITKSSAR